MFRTSWKQLKSTVRAARAIQPARCAAPSNDMVSGLSYNDWRGLEVGGQPEDAMQKLRKCIMDKCFVSFLYKSNVCMNGV